MALNDINSAYDTPSYHLGKSLVNNFVGHRASIHFSKGSCRHTREAVPRRAGLPHVTECLHQRIFNRARIEIGG
jgi:hypothetical protein